MLAAKCSRCHYSSCHTPSAVSLRPLLAMVARTVDLVPVARECWYRSDQRGSCSIKAVIPTLSDLGYDSLELKDGGNAQDARLEAADPACTPDRRWALEEQRKAYCTLDTLAMVAVLRALACEGRSSHRGNFRLIPEVGTDRLTA